MAPYLEGIANAVPLILIYQQTNHTCDQNGQWYAGNQRVSPYQKQVGEAGYIQDGIYHGSNAALGWEELWTINHQIFNEFNSAYLSNRSMGVRDLLKSVMLTYGDYAFDGMSIDDWLDAFGFYNSMNDLPNDLKMISWYAMNSFLNIPSGNINEPLFEFQGMTFTNQNGASSYIPVSNYSVTITDAQTHEILYPNSTDSGSNIYEFLPNELPSRDLLRIDVTANYGDNSEVTLTGYAAKQAFSMYNQGPPPPEGDKMLFFLDTDGFAAGNGTSNVGAISNGVLKWNSSVSEILANVTFNSRTYSYDLENIMANPAVAITQIGICLGSSYIILSPINQTIDQKGIINLQVHINPLVSSGTVTFYSSQDEMHWSQIAQTTPLDGYANATVTSLPLGTNYFKATWSGDGILNSSESTMVETTIFTDTTPTPTPTSTPASTPTSTPPATESPTPTPPSTSTQTTTPTQNPAQQSNQPSTSPTIEGATAKPSSSPSPASSASPSAPEFPTGAAATVIIMSLSLMAIYWRKRHKPFS